MLKGSGSDHGEREGEREAGGVGGPQSELAGHEGSVTAVLQATGGW